MGMCNNRLGEAAGDLLRRCHTISVTADKGGALDSSLQASLSGSASEVTLVIECAYAVWPETTPELGELLVGLDVVYNAGARLLGKKDLTPYDLVQWDAPHWAVLSFVLFEAGKGVECRLWAKGVKLRITDLLLRKLD
jgi:hypothetical protein